MRVSKDEYILRTLSKIKHKKWELFIVTRVIHLLDDPDIEFVCQQLIRGGNGKRYLTDLCFPSLKLYYEIDEQQHSSEPHKITDKIREREIIDATDFTEKRIQVYDKNNNNRDLGEIRKEVDKFIAFIKQRKEEFASKGEFVPWNYETKFSPDIHIKRGSIDVKDNVIFRYQRDAKECFGYKGGHQQNALWKIPGSNKALWFPKLYENNEWDNSLSDDFKRIFMKKKDGSKIGLQGAAEWMVFAHYKDLLGQIVYKFLGEFHASLQKSTNYKHVLIRKQSKIYLRNFEN
jgi:hypothetical protein